MASSWAAAPLWLKAACVAGVPWLLAFVALGAPLLLEDGPGLPLIWVGTLGLVPWAFLAMGEPS
jgi:hypothetical protein